MELTLKDVGGIIKKSWIIILALTILGAMLGFGISEYVLQREYQASAMLIVSTTMKNEDGDTAAMTLNDYNLNAKLVNSYSVLCKSDRVLNQVRDRLDISLELDKLSEKISVSSKQDTDIISISVTDTSPQMAQSIANTLVDIFKGEVAEIMKMDNVQVIDYAALPYKPVRPNVPHQYGGGGPGRTGDRFYHSGAAPIHWMITIKESDLITDIMDIPVIGSVPRLQ